MELKSAEINIYASDPAKEVDGLERPEVIFTENALVFSPFTKFSIYDSYELATNVQDLVPDLSSTNIEDLLAVYDNQNIEILLYHTDITIKNIIFKGKPLHFTSKKITP